MAKCTAPVTGKHESDETEAKCRVCGPKKRRADGANSQLRSIAAPQSNSGPSGIFSEESINTRLRAEERIGRRLSRRECEGIAERLKEMDPTRAEDVLDHYDVVAFTGDSYDGYDVYGYNSWEALARERHHPRLPNWMDGFDMSSYVDSAVAALRHKEDVVWTHSDDVAGEEGYYDFGSADERDAAIREAGDSWDGNIIAVLPPTNAHGDIIDVEELRREQLQSLDINPNRDTALVEYLSVHPISDIFEGSPTLKIGLATYGRVER